MPDLNNIKRNSNDFSFVETAASLVNNREWRSGWDQIEDGKENERTYFWTALSAVGNEIGEVLYENVLNYINNVANINTCKIKPLTSIAKVLGVTEFAVLKNIDVVPNDVLGMMDIFSINKAYLLNINNFNSNFVKDVISSTMDAEALAEVERQVADDAGIPEEDPGQISAFTILGAISQEKYSTYVEEVFYKLLVSKLFQTYGGVSDDFVYSNLSSMGNFSTTGELAYVRSSWEGSDVNNLYWTNLERGGVPSVRSNYGDRLYRYKRVLNVPMSFNETKIVNDIEAGLDFLDNYQGGELSVLNLEIEERSSQKYTSDGGYALNRPNTRYSYYNEKEVKQYVSFINDMFLMRTTGAVEEKPIEEVSSSFTDWTIYSLQNRFHPYFLDTNYSDITLSSNTSLSGNVDEQFAGFKAVFPDATFSDFIYGFYGNVYDTPLLTADSSLSGLAEGNIVRIVAKILRDICFAISDIREKLKTQSQRNYMMGTKLLIEYILDEYVLHSLINNYGVDPAKADNGNFHIRIAEYIDTTEYFNIGDLSDETGFLKGSVNQPYYSNLSDGGFSGSETGLGLIENEIRKFYLSSLNIKSEYISSDDDYFDFMSAVYEVGITKTYVGEDGALYLNEDFLDDGLSTEMDLSALSVAHKFTEEDLEYFETNWYVRDADGYRSINYSVVSAYQDELSDQVDRIESEFVKYNEALSARREQQTELMLKYHGLDVAYYPWYNYKNVDYPTFQAHPYLYNFVEHNNDEYPIENAFYGNANEDLIYELQSENISVYLEEFGNIQRVWRNSNFDYTGYKSRYENSLHSYGTSNSSGLYSVTHYDGIFYPPAISLYKRYASGELKDAGLGLRGFDLLSAHMTTCTETDYYDGENQLDVSNISSMWHYYSHLNLSKAEKKFIVSQLLNLSADILEMSDAEYRVGKGSPAEPYDVYKYGLDYNKNSVILLKRYFDGFGNIVPTKDASASLKKNTPGQIWIKLNSHPIGFPAFLQREDLQQYSQIEINNFSTGEKYNAVAANNAKNEARVSRYGTGAAAANVYDFDLASSGRYLVYAVENPSRSVSEKNYRNSVSIASRILQKRKINYLEPNAEFTRYLLMASGPTFLYPTNDGPRYDFEQNGLGGLGASEYEFDGYFQNNSSLYAGYFKRISDGGRLKSIKFNAIRYPSNKQQSTNPDSRSFYFYYSPEIEALSTDYAVTRADASIKMGFSPKFSNGQNFTIAMANEVLEGDGHFIQDYIGHNNVVGSATSTAVVGGVLSIDLPSAMDMDLETYVFERLTSDLSDYSELIAGLPSNIEVVERSGELSGGFGFVDYIEATSDGREHNSFDRFSHLITLYDISEDDIENEVSPSPMLYALNSDASYIPLYYGVNGQNLQNRLKNKNSGEPFSYNRDWHLPEIFGDSAIVSKESMELLGYSFQDIERFVRDKEETIVHDSATGRYTSLDGDSVLDGALRVYEDFDETGFIFSKYSDGIFHDFAMTAETELTVDFEIDIDGLNAETSSYYSILLLNSNNGKNRNPIIAGEFSRETIDNPFYNAEPTPDEESMLSTGYKVDSMLRIAGTPNPFNEQDISYALEYSNHIFNINGLGTNLIWDGVGKPKIEVVLRIRRPDVSFVVHSNELLLVVYRNTMDQFSKYHYMEPHNLYPHNAAVSAWNIPWKDKTHAEIYLGGWELSDGWKMDGDAIDVDAYKDRRFNDPVRSYVSPVLSEPTNVNLSALVGNLPPGANNPGAITSMNLMDSIELSAVRSLDDVYELSGGQITWKMSEEGRGSALRHLHPPTLIEYLMYEKFGETVSRHESNSVFDLSNTYIFQLEDPVSVAHRIGTIAVPVGNASDEFTLVYEDYLSDQISVDVGGPNFLRYCEIFYDPRQNSSVLSNVSEEESLNIIENELCAINESISNIADFETALSISETSGYFLEGSEKNESQSIIDYALLSASPEEISDYLKIYVNWRKYRNQGAAQDEIELFFNLPNLFMSPYSYKTESGRFVVEYKKNTYARIKSGESGYLYIVFQFKYYDIAGTLCGVRDIPVLTYQIFNVSDDKPKFIITKTYEMDNRDGAYTYPANDNDNIVYIVVDSRHFAHDSIVETVNGKMKMDDAVGYDSRLSADIYVSTRMHVYSPTPLSCLDFELAYERGRMWGSLEGDDPEFVFEPTISKPFGLSDSHGTISGSFDGRTSEATLKFTAFAGTQLDDISQSRTFPIEVMNADGVDVLDNRPKFVFINGAVTFDDDTDGIRSGVYLGRELNKDSSTSIPASWGNNREIIGFVLEEQKRSLIRMYNVRRKPGMKYMLDEGGQTMRTTGVRTSRFDYGSDEDIIIEE